MLLESHPKTRHRLLIGLSIPTVLILSLVVVFFANNRPPNIKIPTPKMPKNNGWNDFAKAAEMVRKASHMGPVSSTRPRSSWTIPQYESFERDNAPALHVLRKGFKKPFLFPPIRNEKQMERSFETFAYLRETARTLASEAIYYQAIDQPGKAANSLLDCVELGVTLPRGGGLIVGSVGNAIEGIGTHFLIPLLPKLSDDELASAAARLDRISLKRVKFREIVLEEGRSSAGFMTDIFRQQTAHLGGVVDVRGWASFNPAMGGSSSKVENVLNNARFAFTNKAGIVRHILTYYKALAAAVPDHYTGKIIHPPIRAGAFTTPSPSFLILTSQAQQVRNETALALIQTQIALLRFKHKRGVYPPDLRSLIPTYLEKVQVDPFGEGKPLRYRVLNGGKSYILYSLGPNLRDDGGKPGVWGGRSTPGDIVAGRR